MKASYSTKELTQYGGMALLEAYIMLELDCSEDEAADIAYNIYQSVDRLIREAE